MVAKLVNGASDGSATSSRLPGKPPPPALDLGLESLLRPLEAASENKVEVEPAKGPTVQELALTHLRPVRDFVLELELGEARSEWLELCRHAVSSLCRASLELHDDALTDALAALARALEHRPSNGHVSFTAEERDALEQAYAAVAKLVPRAEPIAAERERRQPVVVRTVLQQAGVGELHIERIFAAGLGKLSALCGMNADELARATGLDAELASAVAAQFASFRRRMDSIPPDPARAGERARLRKLLDALRQQNEDADPVVWSRDARERRRRLRHVRAETLLQVNILLARLGELGLIDKLERLPFERKTQELEQFLQDFEQQHEHP